MKKKHLIASLATRPVLPPRNHALMNYKDDLERAIKANIAQVTSVEYDEWSQGFNITVKYTAFIGQADRLISTECSASFSWDLDVTPAKAMESLINEVAGWRAALKTLEGK